MLSLVLFFGILAISKASGHWGYYTPIPIEGNEQPAGNTPSLVTTYYNYYSPSSDPCRRVCGLYTAALTTQGEDLCDPNISQCNGGFCTYLYWSTTEDGRPGLIYSLTGQSLTPSERSRPLTCDAAERILMNQSR